MAKEPTVSEPQTYNFHLIFKGLLRFVPSSDKKKLDVLLVDARAPKASVVTGEPLRDHRAVIEFYLDDWHHQEEWRKNSPAALPSLVEVTKNGKGAMGIYLLHRQDLKIGASQGQLSPALTFIEDGSPSSFSKLPQMSEVSPASAPVSADALGDSGKGCIARLLGIDWGEARSERPSTFDGMGLNWAYSAPRTRSEIEHLQLPSTNTPLKDQLKNELAADGKIINLDVRITAKVPVGTYILINPEGIPNDLFAVDPTPFVLQPAAGKDLTVWIKNRELDVILTESDDPKAEEGCRELVDFDFAHFYQISATTHDVRIPYRSAAFDDNPVSNGGCACGVCT
jgi:hypothetical protein